MFKQPIPYTLPKHRHKCAIHGSSHRFTIPVEWEERLVPAKYDGLKRVNKKVIITTKLRCECEEEEFRL